MAQDCPREGGRTLPVPLGICQLTGPWRNTCSPVDHEVWGQLLGEPCTHHHSWQHARCTGLSVLHCKQFESWHRVVYMFALRVSMPSGGKYKSVCLKPSRECASPRLCPSCRPGLWPEGWAETRGRPPRLHGGCRHPHCPGSLRRQRNSLNLHVFLHA